MRTVEGHDLEILRRSIAMLSPGQAVMSREQVLDIIRDLSEAQRQLRALRDDLMRLIETIEPAS